MNRNDIIRRAYKEFARILMSVRAVINRADGVCDIQRALIVGIAGMSEVEPYILRRIVMTFLIGVREHIALFQLNGFLDSAFKKLTNLFIRIARFGVYPVSAAVAIPDGLLVKLQGVVNRVAVNHRCDCSVAYGVGFVPTVFVPFPALLLTCRGGRIKPYFLIIIINRHNITFLCTEIHIHAFMRTGIL